MKHNKRFVLIIPALLTAVALLFPVAVTAQQSSSPSYKVNEVFFGTGGTDTCLEWAQNAGKTYCAKQSIGELTIGNTQGGQFQAQAGFNTDRTPWIEVAVSKSSVDLGVVRTSTTGSDFASFSVKSYLASGYVVQIVGPTPTYDGYAIAGLAVPTASTQNTEQFGINLRLNTTPLIGAEPVQIPDSSFSFGTYGPGYGTVDNYKYVSGDVIAQSTKSSGYTNYTIAYIMNVGGLTPAGEYRADQSIVATATF
ncbi:hypothetical protein KBD11_01360 [Candidatus Saccharibacteria bacterium]|nr:hypothetical protein [Candidatus Saccharibacteria bacterium]